jgi:hypothetical protein
LVAFPIA